MPEAKLSPFPAGKWLRTRRVPTWRLWLLMLIAGGAIFLPLAWSTHGWLSLHEPLPQASYYVVEGWMPDYAVLEGGRQFQDDESALLLLTSGGPLDKGSLLAERKDYATVAAHTLAASGVTASKILPAPCGRPRRERTRVMAEAVKAQLDALNVPASQRSLNLTALGVHARRSVKVYREVLGPEWKVGVICAQDLDYDPAKWWKTSEGARSALTELVALLVNRKETPETLP